MKSMLKRMIKFIVKGVPAVRITNQVVQIASGSLFEGKCFIVTGGSRGIGFSIAQRLIQEKAEVIITGRNEESLRNAQQILGNSCKVLKFDSGHIQEMGGGKLLAACLELSSTGKIDGLVNNAGISLHEGNFRNVQAADFDRQMDINFKGPYFLIQSMIKYFEQFGIAGNIVVITSERGVFSDDLPYGLSKCALNSLVGGICKRVCIEGIRINGVAPGLTDTDLIERKKNENVYAAGQAAGRIHAPEEIAEIVCFLMSDASKCINGQVIVCNSGNSVNTAYNSSAINERYFSQMEGL